jgi:hypothetical protein
MYFFYFHINVPYALGVVIIDVHPTFARKPNTATLKHLTIIMSNPTQQREAYVIRIRGI